MTGGGSLSKPGYYHAYFIGVVKRTTGGPRLFEREYCRFQTNIANVQYEGPKSYVDVLYLR
jgi:hypothetical protein